MARTPDQAKQRRPRPRAAKVLIWMAAFFFVGQTIGGLLLERVWPHYRFPFFYWQLARLDAEPRTPNVMFFGSSRFGSVVSAEFLTDWMQEATGDPTLQAFNAAVPGGDLLVTEQMLNHVLKRDIKLRIVVIEMCPEVVNHRNGWMQLHLQRQICWEDLPTYFGEIAGTGCLPRLLTYRAVPLYQQRAAVCQELSKDLEERLNAWLGVRRPEESSSGRPKVDWQALVLSNPRIVKEEYLRNTQIGASDVPRNLRKYKPGGNAGAALERILQTCHTNGITPILVGVPLSKLHRDHYVRPIEESYQAYLQEITANYGCRYVEYRHRLEDSLFLDNHHASEAGGMTFSRLFTDEVLAPWWKENRPLR